MSPPKGRGHSQPRISQRGSFSVQYWTRSKKARCQRLNRGLPTHKTGYTRGMQLKIFLDVASYDCLRKYLSSDVTNAAVLLGSTWVIDCADMKRGNFCWLPEAIVLMPSAGSPKPFAPAD